MIFFKYFKKTVKLLFLLCMHVLNKTLQWNPINLYFTIRKSTEILFCIAQEMYFQRKHGKNGQIVDARWTGKAANGCRESYSTQRAPKGFLRESPAVAFLCVTKEPPVELTLSSLLEGTDRHVSWALWCRRRSYTQDASWTTNCCLNSFMTLK